MNELKQCGTKEFYLEREKNELLLFAGEWMELENIIVK
jgi:hypothetical protein